jgi:hypothetical protein
VGALADEVEADGDGAEGGEAAVADAEVVADVREEDGVDVFECAGADVAALRRCRARS